MHAHVFKHVPFEDIGCMRPQLEANGAHISYTRFYEPAMLPDVAEIDLLIIMGGPMSVNDEATLPWLVDEKRFIADAIDSGKPVLGICLGAQLIANALGARVYPNAEREIGWFPIRARGDEATALGIPDTLTVFHWHGETFDLPADATLLASSEACTNQAFMIGRKVIGLQCHPEMTRSGVQALIAACGNELQPAPFVQSGNAMLDVPDSDFAAANALMNTLLEYLLVASP